MTMAPSRPAGSGVAPPVGDPEPERGPVAARRTSPRWSRLTSVPVLAAALVGFTVLAAGPLHRWDEALHARWVLLTPELEPFVQQVLDRVAGQAVCLPVLATVALVLAWRHRTWRPVLTAASAELAFYAGIGLLKVVLARPAPMRRDTDFFDGGVLSHGWQGISYPSGHAAEAVLVYGTAVYLVWRWTSASRSTMALLVALNALITVNAVVVSFYLGWHWVTDLVGGVFAGALFLRLVVVADRRLLGSSRRAATRPTAGAGQPGSSSLALAGAQLSPSIR